MLQVAGCAANFWRYVSDVPEKKDSLLSLIRVACYAHQIGAIFTRLTPRVDGISPLILTSRCADEAIELANLCLSRGYEVSINLMAVAKQPIKVVEECLDKVAAVNSGTEIFYLPRPPLSVCQASCRCS